MLANTLHGTLWLLRSLDCWWTLGIASDQWFCRTRHCEKSMLMHERFWLSTEQSGIYIQSLAEIYYLVYTFSCNYIQIIALIFLHSGGIAQQTRRRIVHNEGKYLIFHLPPSSSFHSEIHVAFLSLYTGYEAVAHKSTAWSLSFEWSHTMFPSTDLNFESLCLCSTAQQTLPHENKAVLP